MREKRIALKNYFMREGEIFQLLGSNKYQDRAKRAHSAQKFYLG